MIAGRLHWPGRKTRNALALFEFESGTLALTEAGTKRRASLHLVAGIGNAYSDEILHRAKLSPIALTKDLSTEEAERLYESARAVLQEWTRRLRTEGFPEKVDRALSRLLKKSWPRSIDELP